MKMKKTVFYIYWVIHTRLLRIGMKKKADDYAAMFLGLPTCGAAVLGVAVYQENYGSIFKLPAAGMYLVLILCALATSAIWYLYIRPKYEGGEYGESCFTEWYYQGWNGRILVIAYMSMIVWLPLSAWFVFKYVL